MTAAPATAASGAAAGETCDLPRLERGDMRVRADTLDESARTVDVIWSTGARVRRRHIFRDDFDEELDLAGARLERFNAGAPLLSDHAAITDFMVGSIEPGTARVEGSQGVATVRFAEGTAEADRIWSLVQQGHLRAVSVGYRIHRLEITERDGEPDLVRAVDWEPLELSAVAIGADPAAVFRSQDATTLNRCELTYHRKEGTMPENIQTAASQQDAVAAERERVGTINEMVRRHGLDGSFGDQLVRNGTPLDQARTAILDALATRDEQMAPRSVHVTAPIGGQDETTTRREAVATALAHRMGGSDVPDPTGGAASEFRGLTLLDMARAVAEPGGSSATMSRNEVAARALNSTSDFPAILTGAVQRTLAARFQRLAPGLLPIARRTTATDFKPLRRVQLGEAPALRRVAEGGNFERGTTQESEETYKVETYGRVFGLTRQAVVNDDLSALETFTQDIARASSDVLADLLVQQIAGAGAIMADGLPLFHASHGNLSPAADLTVDAIAEARKAMRSQRGRDGQTRIDARPRFLVVGADLETEAEKMLAQIQPNSAASVNPFAGRLELVVEPRLEGNDWMLFSDPALTTVVEYAELDGERPLSATGPQVDQRIGFDFDGLEFRVRYDVGAGVVAHQGAHRVPGL